MARSDWRATKYWVSWTILVTVIGVLAGGNDRPLVFVYCRRNRGGRDCRNYDSFCRFFESTDLWTAIRMS